MNIMNKTPDQHENQFQQSLFDSENQFQDQEEEEHQIKNNKQFSIYGQVASLEVLYEDDIYSNPNKEISKQQLEKQEFLNQYSSGDQDKVSLYQDSSRFIDISGIQQNLSISIRKSECIYELLSTFYCNNQDSQLMKLNFSKILNQTQQLFDEEEDNQNNTIFSNLLNLLHKYACNHQNLNIKSDEFLQIIIQDDHLKILVQIYNYYQEYLNNKEQKNVQILDSMDIELEQNNFLQNLLDKLQSNSN